MKNFIYAAAACAALAACTKEMPSPVKGSDEKVRLSISLEGIQPPFTKVSSVSSEDETAVNTVQLFICDESGVVEAYQKATGSQISVNVSTGSKNIYAVVNAPDLTNIRTETALLGQQSSLEDNSVGHLVMSGALLDEAVSSESSSKTITVKRLVAKVTLQKLTRNFTNSELAGKELRLRGIYLTDVVANTAYFGGDVEYSWYNRLQHTASEPNALIYDAVTGTLAQNGIHSTPHSFYPYPNDSPGMPTGAAAGTWSERRTMLVIDTTLDGQDNYYPVYLPEIESNKTYTITDFTITKRGSKHPWEPVESKDVSFVIDVADWETGASYTETI